jgi:hypothetical protein
MTIAPVASTGIEPATVDSSADTPPSGFDLLLAGARSTTGPLAANGSADDGSGGETPTGALDPSDPAPDPRVRNDSTPTASDETGKDTAGTAPTTGDANGAPASASPATGSGPATSTPKPTHGAALGGLVGALAALAWTPAPPASPVVTTPPASDSAPPTQPPPDPTAPTVATTTTAVAVASSLASNDTPDAVDATGTVDVASMPASNPPAALTADPTRPSGPGTAVAPPTSAPSLSAVPNAATLANGNGANANDTNPNANPNAHAPAPAMTTVSATVAGTGPSERPRPATQPLTSVTSTGTTSVAAASPAATSAITGAGDTDVGTAAATVAPPPTAEQLVSVLTPLRTTTNGSYTLRLELKPAELGRIDMRVEMKDGVLHASIHADRESSADLVRDSLSELRKRLEAEGIQTGEFTVSDGGVGSDTSGGRDRPLSPTSTNTSTDDATPAAAEVIPSLGESDATSLFDVRV